MMAFYKIGTPSTNEYEREIGVSDVGNSRQLILAYCPFLVVQILLLVCSHIWSLKIFTKACVLAVLIRHHLEFLFVDVIAPLEIDRGHNRVKLWVGTFMIAYQYYIRLEIMNSNFSEYTRIPIIIGSCILTVYSLARL